MGWDWGGVMAFPLVSSLFWGVEYDRPSLNPFCFQRKFFASCLWAIRDWALSENLAALVRPSGSIHVGPAAYMEVWLCQASPSHQPFISHPFRVCDSQQPKLCKNILIVRDKSVWWHHCDCAVHVIILWGMHCNLKTVRQRVHEHSQDSGRGVLAPKRCSPAKVESLITYLDFNTVFWGSEMILTLLRVNDWTYGWL